MPNTWFQPAGLRRLPMKSEPSATGSRQQTLGQRHGRAATAAAGRFAGVPGVAGGAKHLVEGVRAQAKFGCVGFADDDGASGFHAPGHQAVLAGHEVFHQRTAQSGAQTLGIGQVLDGLGHAVHPAHGLAPGQLCIALARLSHQPFRFLQADDGIGLRVQASNALECGPHDLLARHLLAVYGAGQIQCGGIRVDHVVMLSGLFVL